MAKRQSRTFLHVFRHSLVPYDTYYSKILHQTRLWFSLKYFVALSIFMVMIELGLTMNGMPSRYSFIKSQTEVRNMINQIPSDLIINLNQGKLTTNYDRPIMIFSTNPDKPDIFAVVDQQASRVKMNEYNPTLMFASRELIASIDGQIMSFSYTGNKLPQHELNIPIGTLADSLIKLLPAIYLVGFFTIPIFVLFSRILLLLIISFVVYLICIKIIPEIRMKKVFQISLHAATAPIVLQAASGIFKLSVPMSFWWFIVITTIFVIGCVYEAYVISGTKHTHSEKTTTTTKKKKKTSK